VEQAQQSILGLQVKEDSKRVAGRLIDAVRVCGAVSVVMQSRFDVGRRVAVMRVDVSVCGRERVAASLTAAVSVCGAVSIVMWSRLDGLRRVNVMLCV
jgi:hypothetical protein